MQATRDRSGPSGDADLPYHGFDEQRGRKRTVAHADEGDDFDDGMNAGMLLLLCCVVVCFVSMPTIAAALTLLFRDLDCVSVCLCLCV